MLRLQKIAKEIKLKVAWGELEAASVCRQNHFEKYLRQALVFISNSAI